MSATPPPSKTVLVPLVNGFEEIETVTPVDLLRRAGAEVILASVTGEMLLKGRCGMVLKTDSPLDSVIDRKFDMLFLPGGPGVAALRADGRPASLARRMHDTGATVAAICAAPTVLADAGLLAGRRHTAHFSVHAELPSAEATQAVVCDGRILTSRGAGTALPLGLAMIRSLYGSAAEAEISRQIMA